jgi:hypothetical protein
MCSINFSYPLISQKVSLQICTSLLIQVYRFDQICWDPHSWWIFEASSSYLGGTFLFALKLRHHLARDFQYLMEHSHSNYTQSSSFLNSMLLFNLGLKISKLVYRCLQACCHGRPFHSSCELICFLQMIHEIFEPKTGNWYSFRFFVGSILSLESITIVHYLYVMVIAWMSLYFTCGSWDAPVMIGKPCCLPWSLYVYCQRLCWSWSRCPPSS